MSDETINNEGKSKSTNITLIAIGAILVLMITQIVYLYYSLDKVTKKLDYINSENDNTQEALSKGLIIISGQIQDVSSDVDDVYSVVNDVYSSLPY